MGKLKIWYDAEGDFLEIDFSNERGEFRSTDSENVMLKVNNLGQMIGFAVMNISSVDRDPLEIEVPIEELRRILEQHGVPIEF
jgi:uncharacterized protein YuzE